MTTIPKRMHRLEKHGGFGNISLVTADVPVPGAHQVLVRNRKTLISRGSEIGGRYRKDGTVSPDSIGYSAAGDVVAIGEGVDDAWIGRRVAVMAPHAEYVLGDLDAIAARAVTPIPDGVSYEQATFHPLVLGGVIWSAISAPKAGEQVAVVGLGLVGNLVLQAAKRYNPARLIGIDAINARCDLALQLGADDAVNAAKVDPVERILELTGGDGADLVFECVGGPAGVRSFPQAVRMTRKLGRVHLISLYHEEPLPLDSSAIQGRMLIGGYYTDLDDAWRPSADEAMRRIAAGEVEVERLVSHRFRPGDATAAFDLLHNRLADAMGVIFDWES